MKTNRFSAIKSALHLLHVAPAVRSVQRKLKADAAAKPVTHLQYLHHTQVSVSHSNSGLKLFTSEDNANLSHSGPHEAQIAQTNDITEENAATKTT